MDGYATLNLSLETAISNASWKDGTLISLNYDDLPVMLVVGTVLMLLTIATFLGNLLVCIALIKIPALQTVSNYLIGNLAASDLLLALTILPLSTVNECLGHWVFGREICYFWLCADVLYSTASIWNLCVIALDRFTATLYPVWYRDKRSARQAIMYIFIVWLSSFMICVPPLLGWNDLGTSYIYMPDTGIHQCMLFQERSYVLYSALGSFYLPFVVTISLYICIFISLNNRASSLRDASIKSNRSSSRASNRSHAGVKSSSRSTKRDRASSTREAMLPQSDKSDSEFNAKSSHIRSFKDRSRSFRDTYSDLKDRSKSFRGNVMKRFQSRELRATKRMALIITCFFLCYIGFFICYVLGAWFPAIHIPEVLMNFFNWLGYANSTLNPILYATFNQEFKKAFIKILRCS